ncbi:17361_t:CDS:2, partial [Acaulospora morrowiae]
KSGSPHIRQVNVEKKIPVRRTVPMYIGTFFTTVLNYVQPCYREKAHVMFGLDALTKLRMFQRQISAIGE